MEKVTQEIEILKISSGSKLEDKSKGTAIKPNGGVTTTITSSSKNSAPSKLTGRLKAICERCYGHVEYYPHDEGLAKLLGEHADCEICRFCLDTTISKAGPGACILCPTPLCNKVLSGEILEAIDTDGVYEMYLLRCRPIECSTSRCQTNQSIECFTCLEYHPSSNFPERLTNSCKHPLGTCSECVEALLANALDGNEWIDPECPECKETLSPTDVLRLGTSDQAAVYNERLTKRYLESLPEYRMCLGPKCDSGQLHDGGDNSPIVNCQACGFKICFVHNTPWHHGLTCEEYDDDIKIRAQAEKEAQERIEKSEVLVRLLSKACPKCKFDIQKTGGCNHMKCSVCGHEFCYLCFASYDKIRAVGNAAHVKGCPSYA